MVPQIKKILYAGILTKKVNWVLDADIRGFYDALNHGWLVKFIEHRIADRRIVRLIRNDNLILITCDNLILTTLN